MSDFIASLQFRLQRNQLAFVALFLLCLAARGQSIFAPMYAIDTYAFEANNGAYELMNLALRQGRFGLAGLWWLSGQIGSQGYPAASSGQLFATLMYIASGYLLAVVILPRATQVEVFTASAIFALHPFMNEFFHFADATFDFAFATFMALLGIYIIERRGRRVSSWMLAALLICAALSIYQTAIVYCIVAVLLKSSIALADKNVTLPKFVRREVPAFAVIAVGTAIYLAIARCIALYIGAVTDARLDLSAMLDLRNKAAVAFQATSLALWPRWQYVPELTSALLVAILLLSVALIAILVTRSRGLSSAILAVIAIALALVLSASLTSVGRTVWLVPRTLAGFAAFGAGLSMICWHLCGYRMRFILGAVLLVLIAGYVGVANRIIHDSVLVNRWDRSQASRIVARWEQLPGFDQIRTMEVVGGRYYRDIRLYSVWGDMNISGFSAAWSKRGVLEQATGYRYAAPTEADIKTASEYCAKSGVWPSPDSTTILSGVATVCLPKS